MRGSRPCSSPYRFAGLIAPAATADALDVAGPWKLVLMTSGEVEFAIFDLKVADGKLAAEVTNASRMDLDMVKPVEGVIQGHTSGLDPDRQADAPSGFGRRLGPRPRRQEAPVPRERRLRLSRLGLGQAD